jgi:hypothetical protein
MNRGNDFFKFVTALALIHMLICVRSVSASGVGQNCTHDEEHEFSECINALEEPTSLQEKDAFCNLAKDAVACAKGCICESDMFQEIYVQMHTVWHELKCGDGHLECGLSVPLVYNAGVLICAAVFAAVFSL